MSQEIWESVSSADHGVQQYFAPPANNSRSCNPDLGSRSILEPSKIIFFRKVGCWWVWLFLWLFVGECGWVQNVGRCTVYNNSLKNSNPHSQILNNDRNQVWNKTCNQLPNSYSELAIRRQYDLNDVTMEFTVYFELCTLTSVALFALKCVYLLKSQQCSYTPLLPHPWLIRK